MASLVADYSSSSNVDSDSDDNSDDDDTVSKEMALKLPKPLFGKESSECAETSVFTNRYQAAENAKVKVLEKHVKMTSKPESIVGKKVCWNHRKGRCRFGHNCRFAHDTDLIITRDAQPNNVQDFHGGSSVSHEEEIVTIKKKRKPGMSQTLIPPKAAMKAFSKQQQQERPWLSTNAK